MMSIPEPRASTLHIEDRGEIEDRMSTVDRWTRTPYTQDLSQTFSES